MIEPWVSLNSKTHPCIDIIFAVLIGYRLFNCFFRDYIDCVHWVTSIKKKLGRFTTFFPFSTYIHVMDTALTDAHVIRVPEYFYAVDINYLTHMIGKEKSPFFFFQWKT